MTVTAINDAGSIVLAGTGIAGSEVTATLTDIDGLDGQEIIFELLNNGQALSTPVTATVTGSDTTAEVSFTINVADFSTGEGITVRASYTDEDGTDYTGILSNAIDSSNTAPVAVADTVTIAEDSAETTINVIANDTDLDGDSLVVTAVEGAVNGTTRFENGNVFYTANAKF